MLTEYDSELLAKNQPHKCRDDYIIYFSLSRGWELHHNCRGWIMENLKYCPFCGRELT